MQDFLPFLVLIDLAFLVVFQFSSLRLLQSIKQRPRSWPGKHRNLKGKKKWINNAKLSMHYGELVSTAGGETSAWLACASNNLLRVHTVLNRCRVHLSAQGHRGISSSVCGNPDKTWSLPRSQNLFAVVVLTYVSFILIHVTCFPLWGFVKEEKKIIVPTPCHLYKRFIRFIKRHIVQEKEKTQS